MAIWYGDCTSGIICQERQSLKLLSLAGKEKEVEDAPSSENCDDTSVHLVSTLASTYLSIVSDSHDS
ncbi:unnamed protein product [Ilex paraguariensis]|uniref:Uncharacterized protein n=1 Tax=Ilex paraguariensis TaxID=185542 RepID=A0ABC8S1V5_9AQUA